MYGTPTEDGDLKICAKIVYDKEQCQEAYQTQEENELYKIFQAKVKEINKTMPAYKYIREIRITDKELIKTTTQKVKRHEEISNIQKES